MEAPRGLSAPSLRTAVARPMIDTLKQGQFIYAHGPGTQVLSECRTENLSLVSLTPGSRERAR